MLAFEREPTNLAGTKDRRENEYRDGLLNIHSVTDRDALLNRLCLDGGAAAAFSLRCLYAESPRLAAPIIEHLARYTDEIDDLLVSLGDAAARRAAA